MSCFSCFSILVVYVWLFFFFKQKTAYEMLRSLVGSEMCIRDSINAEYGLTEALGEKGLGAASSTALQVLDISFNDAIGCLLYTSDAADEEDSVALGGRRIINKYTIDKLDIQDTM
eukprot:TRINITY_DN16828_c0_g1_i1.p1 TRINITY_DN16828_c0_g1~~TRINITY_DN16828_c0_g1_i1.p1  ORF type:complete len:116 (-),score=35.95 TRINITY_DN16828_c0_g1_i1:29-376(-)